jgi:hypothetical protein
MASMLVHPNIFTWVNPNTVHTWVSPTSSDRVVLRLNGFWKPPPAFLFLPTSASPVSKSLSSSALTFLALFLRGAAFFLAGFALSPPRVLRPLARLFSWACSWAARRASASSAEDDRLTFFREGSGVADCSVSPASDVPLVAYGSTEEGGTMPLSAPETASKRSSIRRLMASYRAELARRNEKVVAGGGS